MLESPSSPRRRPALLALVVGVHLLAVLLLSSQQSWRRADPVTRSTQLIEVRLQPRQAVPAPAPAGRGPSRSSAPVAATAAAPRILDEDPAVPAEPAQQRAEVPASGPNRSAAGFDHGSIGRAVGDAARNPSLAYQARVRDGKAAPTQEQRLQAGVTRAGRRDCLNANVNPGAQGDSTLRLLGPVQVGGIFVAPLIVADALLGKCGL